MIKQETVTVDILCCDLCKKKIHSPGYDDEGVTNTRSKYSSTNICFVGGSLELARSLKSQRYVVHVYCLLDLVEANKK